MYFDLGALRIGEEYVALEEDKARKISLWSTWMTF